MYHTKLLLQILKAEERARLEIGTGKKSKEGTGKKGPGRKKEGILSVILKLQNGFIMLCDYYFVLKFSSMGLCV